MGTVVGVVIGYVLGVRAGDKGWEELQEAWSVIRNSQEVRDLITGAFAMVREAVRNGFRTLTRERAESGRASSLRPVA